MIADIFYNFRFSYNKPGKASHQRITTVIYFTAQFEYLYFFVILQFTALLAVPLCSSCDRSVPLSFLNPYPSGTGPAYYYFFFQLGFSMHDIQRRQTAALQRRAEPPAFHYGRFFYVKSQSRETIAVLPALYNFLLIFSFFI